MGVKTNEVPNNENVSGYTSHVFRENFCLIWSTLPDTNYHKLYITCYRMFVGGKGGWCNTKLP